MSNPQRQVGNRRLPPLLKVNSAFVKVDHAGSGAVSSHSGSHKNNQTVVPLYKVCGQLPYDLTSAFLEGPFRPAIPLDTVGQFSFTSGFASPILTEIGSRAALDSSNVEGFLKDNPDFLSDFVRIHVAKQQLEKWLEEKVKLDFDEDFSVSGLIHAAKASAKWKNCSCVERQHFMEDFVNDVHRVHSDVRGSILSQLVDSCASAVDADGHILYLTDNEGKHIWPYLPLSSKPISLQEVKEGTTIACYVAASKETVRTSQITGDERFPMGIGVQDTTAHSVMCQPIIQPSGELTGVIELIRVVGVPHFTEKDEQVVNSYLTWGGIVLYYAEMYHTMHKQRKLNEFLLNVTKSIFQDIVSMDTVIMKIMNFAQTLVDADRTSLFLVDTRTNELYARIFDIGTGLDTKLQKEIRFPKNKGVAGHVATTGETLNITDAYSEPRFNRDIDVQTGYTTRTLLCMPIFIRGNIIGVVQMVNKKTGVFTAADEKAFQTFAVYCGLALHHAKLYDKIRRSEQKYKVALEVLSYHSMCSEEELVQLKMTDVEKALLTLDRFEFNCYEFSGIQMAKLSINMFSNIFKFERFDPDVLARFVLTVRKNYRRVPYHNWTHAFSVAHCMFACLKRSGGQIPDVEAVSLFVACLCHDLDHRGKNNDWMKSESTPLAAVYTTSTLEHHHFNQTITILQHEGHNIFAHFTSNDYKQVLGFVKDCILSTDLATFFGNKARLKDVLDANAFSWENNDHRKMVRALAMTACDLSACAKPWKIQYETVKVIFQEFYAQGDEEKALGRTPVPMMDRDTADKLPQHQVGFLVGICIPCYDLLQRLLPDTRPLLDGAKKNLQRWTEMVSKQNEKRDREKEEKEAAAREASAQGKSEGEKAEGTGRPPTKKENGLAKAAENFRSNARKDADDGKGDANTKRKETPKEPLDLRTSPVNQKRSGSGSSSGSRGGNTV